jgi:hypothetical protein
MRVMDSLIVDAFSIWCAVAALVANAVHTRLRHQIMLDKDRYMQQSYA